MMYVCTFVFQEYGHSGNELPPPLDGGYSRSVLSGDEEETGFSQRMNREGNALRDILEVKWKAEERPGKEYSRAPTVSWSVSPVTTMTGIVRDIFW